MAEEDMNLKRLIYLKEQSSIINEEQCEIVSIWEVECGGHTGFIIREDICHKRDIDSEWRTSNKDLLEALKEEDELWRFDEEMFKMKPENRKITEEIGKIYESMID